ncbi:MAG: AAA family ATPase [Deltaproteobacteria bacterium]|nr:AAA family ATPase [Candidatus Anaeroferrophillacea bacterium]
MSKLKKAMERARLERSDLPAEGEPETVASAGGHGSATPTRTDGAAEHHPAAADRTAPGGARPVATHPPSPAHTAPAGRLTAPRPTPPTHAADGTRQTPPAAGQVQPAAAKTRIREVSADLLRRHRVIASCVDSPFADNVKVLRTRIITILERFSGNSLLITSPRENEGKTLTAVNLAISIAQEINRTTLLVDADLRRPSVAAYFGFTEEHGLADYLLDKMELHDLLINPSIPKLTILPGGRPLGNSSEMLGSARAKKHFTEMKERYADRFLVFDSPALLSGADALVLSEYVDGILLVVEAERTPAAAVTKSLELLKDRPVIGTVFNKAR